MQGSAYNVGLPGQQTQNIAPTAGAAATGIQDLSQAYGGFGPYSANLAQNTATNLYNNPYAGGYQAGANAAAPYATATGQAQFGAGATMLPYAQSLLQMGADPQQALYNRTLQQTMDQQNAAMAGAGVGTTPYGQGLQSQNLQNFNMDWNNQQLARTLAANQGAGQTYQTALGFMGQAAPSMMQGAAIPYSTYGGIGQGQLGALSGGLGVAGQGANLSQLPIQDYMSLLSGQSQANAVANQTAKLGLDQSQLGWGQMMQLGQGIGSLAGAGMGFMPGMPSLPTSYQGAYGTSGSGMGGWGSMP